MDQAVERDRSSLAPDRPAAAEAAREPAVARPYWNPYAAGVGLGLTLLLAFFLTGGGLGASGAFARFTAQIEQLVAPGHLAASPYWRGYLGEGALLKDWLVFEILGVLVGGILGALTAGRFRPSVDHGPGVTSRRRMWLAFGGGIVVGFATRLARGCTSGQALTGGAQLAAGSWAFMMSVFAGGYAAAWFARRQWN